MEFRIPRSLKLEHDELHTELARAINAGGEVGEKAKGVAKLLHPHFMKEEEFALPPLGLLSALAEGRVKPEMARVLPMTDRLAAELHEMVAEHESIVAALRELLSAARRTASPEYAESSEKLILHARTEEEVLYPAAILIGQYLKLKLNR